MFHAKEQRLQTAQMFLFLLFHAKEQRLQSAQRVLFFCFTQRSKGCKVRKGFCFFVSRKGAKVAKCAKCFVFINVCKLPTAICKLLLAIYSSSSNNPCSCSSVLQVLLLFKDAFAGVVLLPALFSSINFCIILFLSAKISLRICKSFSLSK